MARTAITAIVIARNEEHNLAWCLRSVRGWCDEIVVVDMESDDRTAEIAGRYADRVVPHPVIPDFDRARLVAVEHATSPWIFSLDADEIAHPDLGEHLRGAVEADPPFDALRIPRVNIMLGRWIRHSGWWPNRHYRFFRREALNISGTLHQGLRPKPESRLAQLPADARLAIWHFSYLSLEDYVGKVNRYSSIEARQLISAGAPRPSLAQLFGKPVYELVARYVRRGGYRDGRQGLVLAISRAYYRFLLRAKLWDEPLIESRRRRYDAMRDRLLRDAPGPAAPRSPSATSSAAAPEGAARLARGVAPSPSADAGTDAAAVDPRRREQEIYS